DKAEAVLALAAELGLDARIVGRVETSVKKMVTISSPFGTFKYD
ncbi:MAG TPA: phosphoribosylformylglycinamidine cyclo-ligase, partial [Bacteroidales bacterium]|nr:phosphoribosylformylglycinamidine cyclo-ligase [Bacteroidales bacterium]